MPNLFDFVPFPKKGHVGEKKIEPGKPDSIKIVVVRGFEPRQTEPKPVVLPLHHTTVTSLLF